MFTYSHLLEQDYISEYDNYMHLQSHLAVAANLAGAVDDALRQGRPGQSVFTAAEA